jgi:CelD/BcsL family acetyltransferase involved in cellulose biosynthesis
LKALSGDQAWSQLQDTTFLERWAQLYSRCPWATPCQSPQFVTTWFEYYGALFSPILVQQDGNEGLAGLLVLAASKEENRLVLPGTHQAEYQSWLADDDCPNDFPAEALAAAEEIHPGKTATVLKYLPRGAPVDAIAASGKLSNRTAVRGHRRPLMRIDPEAIDSSFRKKSNKSRFSRLRKLGQLDFFRVTDPRQLEKVFDRLIEFYDFRQGATNDSFPFTDDANKKPFHMALMARHPEMLHVTVTTLDGEPVAAHIGLVGNDAVHLAILAYSPFHARHSLGKLHLMQLGRQFVDESIPFLDLTPGDDPWKERFADEHDDVFELIVYRKAGDKRSADASNRGLGALKGFLDVFGVTPAQLRNVATRLRRFAPDKLLSWLTRAKAEVCIYSLSSEYLPTNAKHGTVERDRLADLLKYRGEPALSRHVFIRDALNRVERGEHSYTVASDDALLFSAWLLEKQKILVVEKASQNYDLPENSAVIYVPETHTPVDDGYFRQTIYRMLADIRQHGGKVSVYTTIDADDPRRRVLEELRFVHLGTLSSPGRNGFSKTRRTDFLTTAGRVGSNE